MCVRNDRSVVDAVPTAEFLTEPKLRVFMSLSEVSRTQTGLLMWLHTEIMGQTTEYIPRYAVEYFLCYSPPEKRTRGMRSKDQRVLPLETLKIES